MRRGLPSPQQETATTGTDAVKDAWFRSFAFLDGGVHVVRLGYRGSQLSVMRASEQRERQGSPQGQTRRLTVVGSVKRERDNHADPVGRGHA
jgi:hypothetical protein